MQRARGELLSHEINTQTLMNLLYCPVPFRMAGVIRVDLSLVKPSILKAARIHMKRGYLTRIQGPAYELTCAMAAVTGFKMSHFSGDKRILYFPKEDLEMIPTAADEFRTLIGMNITRHSEFAVGVTEGPDYVHLSGTYLYASETKHIGDKAGAILKLFKSYTKRWAWQRQKALHALTTGEFTHDIKFQFDKADKRSST